MMDENKAMHSDGCTCNSDKMGSNKYHKHTLFKFMALCIVLFVAFWYGVQIGEIKGALGINPFTESMMRVHTQQAVYPNGTVMYGAQQ